MMARDGKLTLLLAVTAFVATTAESSKSVVVNLEAGKAASDSSAMADSGVSWVVNPTDPSGATQGQCKKMGVLKLAFNLCDRRRAQIDLHFKDSQGFSFNLGDSRTNNGYAGDASSQANCAEVHSISKSIFFDGRDKSKGVSYGQQARKDDFINGKVTLVVQDGLIEARNCSQKVVVKGDTMFALNNTPDFEGPVNNDLYLGLNRVVGSSYRKGTGLCKVEIKFFDTML